MKKDMALIMLYGYLKLIAMMKAKVVNKGNKKGVKG
jgi:hypothetical protein